MHATTSREPVKSNRKQFIFFLLLFIEVFRFHQTSARTNMRFVFCVQQIVLPEWAHAGPLMTHQTFGRLLLINLIIYWRAASRRWRLGERKKITAINVKSYCTPARHHYETTLFARF